MHSGRLLAVDVERTGRAAARQLLAGALVVALVATLFATGPPDARAQSADREELREQSVDAATESGASALQSADITPVPRDASGALTLGQAIMRDTARLDGARFVAVPPAGTPHATATSLSHFPTGEDEFAILTTGDATLADDLDAFASVNLGGGNVRGNTDYDVTVLELDVTPPAGVNCLRFDFAFYSEEYPDWVGTAYNDAFIAELDQTTWTTSGSAILAPDNFAFDPTGAPVSINSTGVTSMSSSLAGGTTYGGGTELLQAGTALDGSGARSLYLSIFDQGDQVLDSAVFVDDLHFVEVRDPETMCISGVKRPGDLPPLRREQTWGPGSGTHGVNPSGTQSDPVNSATGAFVYEAVDLSTPGLGVPFTFSRSYTSEDIREGPLGAGWTHNLDMALEFEPGGDAVLRTEDGQRLPYRLADDGSYVAAPGGRSRLHGVDDGFELVRMDQVVYGFDADGVLQSVRDPNGMGLELAYDDGALVTVTDAAGREVSLTHDSDRLTAVTTPDGRTVEYGYSDNLLTSVTDPRGGTITYEYDAEDHLTRIVDADGKPVVENTYGADGRVIEQTDGFGNTSTFAWDPEAQTSTMTDAHGGTHVDHYQEFVLVAREDPLGNRVEFTYDDDLNLVAVTDPRGHTAEMTYDLEGNLLELAAPEPLGYTRSWTYDDDNNVLAETDGRGNVTDYRYDGNGNLVEIEHPDGAVETFERDPATGAVVAVTDPLGHTSTLAHDQDGNVVRTTTPLGLEVELSYGAAGRPVVVTTPAADGTAANLELEYDEGGNVVALTDPLGNETERTYDARGLLASETDALGRTTTWEHDVFGRVVEVVTPDGAATTYAYDAVGNLIERTDPLDRTTTYDYDSAGRLTGVTSPAEQRWTFAYDANGNVIEAVDPVGHESDRIDARTTTYEYDELNRLVGIGYADDAGELPAEPEDPDDDPMGPGDPQGGPPSTLQLRALCSTDPDDTRRWRVRNTTDQPVEATWEILRSDASGTHVAPPGDSVITTPTQRGNNAMRLEWDDEWMIRGSGRVVCADEPTDPTPVTPTTPSVTFAYDANSNRVRLTDGSGAVEYEYDESDRLVEVRRGADMFTYAYDAAGQLAARSLPDGREQTFAHDEDGRLETLTEAGETTEYVWGADGRLAERLRPNATREERTYDLAGRLSEVRHVDEIGEVLAAFMYTRDAVGNPTVVGSHDGVRTHAYDDRDQLVETCYDPSCDDAVRYTYDLVGNRLTEERPAGTTTYDYDAADRLETAVGPSGSITYGYDANGNRTRAGDWRYTYDAEDRLFSADDGSGATVYGYDGDGRRLRAEGPGVDLSFSWDVNNPVPTLAVESAAGEALRGYTHGLGLEAVHAGGARFDLHLDALGSVRAVTGASGDLLSERAYEPFGTLRDDVATGGPDVPLGFAGAHLDPATGLYHMGARDYDPATGTFTRIDPIAQAVGDPYVSAYVYANNRPTVLTDPTGLCPFCVLAGVGAAVGGVVSGAAYALTTDEFSWRELGGAVVGGAAAGAVTAVAGPLGGSIATSLGASATGATALAATAGINAVGGAAATTLQTGVGQGRLPTVQEAALGGGITAVSGFAGNVLFPMRGVHTVAQARHFAPRSWSSLVSGGHNITALYGSSFTGSLVGAGLATALGVPGYPGK